MELNAETVKEWLEICAEDTPYPDQSQALLDALALINSQEQRIKELTEENERLRARRTIDEKFKYCNLVGDSLIYNKTLEDYNKLRADFRADTVKKMQERLQAYFGTYVLGYKIPLTEALKAVNQIAKEMLEGEK